MPAPDRGVDWLAVGHVGGDRDRVEPVLGDDLAQRLFGTTDQREPGAFGGEAASGFEPHA
ncbi:MAG TPA: hypothetical protein VK501_16255 [Baekduia sp.]|nr:hypothetical protein [Baekduia sp.]HMJ35462.1 hypothetical protein [Baekduia sp.]